MERHLSSLDMTRISIAFALRPTRMSIAVVAVIACGSPTTAQPCNPVIDGTYCAEQMPKRSKARAASRPATNMRPIQPIGRSSSPRQESPATFGGISFSNTGERCVGFMRRGSCK
jgi:hypothetical protein